MFPVVFSHLYDPSIVQLHCRVNINDTVLDVRNNVIQTYKLQNTFPNDIELYINNNCMVPMIDNNKLLFEGRRDFEFIYWFNNKKVANKFQQWLNGDNMLKFVKQCESNIHHPIIINLKNIYRFPLYNSKYYALFDYKLTSINDLCTEIIQFESNLNPMMHLRTLIKDSETPYNLETIVLSLHYKDNQIIIRNNKENRNKMLFDCMQKFIHSEQEHEEKKNENNDCYIFNIKLCWFDLSKMELNKFYKNNIHKTKLISINNELIFDDESKYTMIYVKNPIYSLSSSMNGLFEISDDKTIQNVKDVLDDMLCWNKKDRIYFIIYDEDNIQLLTDENNDDLLCKYINKEAFQERNTLNIWCFNKFQLFSYEGDDKYLNIFYKYLNEINIMNKDSLKLKLHLIASESNYWSTFEVNDCMTISFIKETIIDNIYCDSSDDNILLFDNGKLLNDTDSVVINNATKCWELDVISLKKHFSDVLIPKHYVTCLRYWQYVLTSVIDMNIISWSNDLSVILSLYLFGVEWPITNVMQQKQTTPYEEHINVGGHRRVMDIYPYETCGGLVQKILKCLRDIGYSLTSSHHIALCETDENVDTKSIYEIGLFHSNIEDEFSVIKRNSPTDIDKQHLVYFAKRKIKIKENMLRYRTAYPYACKEFEYNPDDVTLQTIKDKISQEEGIDVNKITLYRHRYMYGAAIETDEAIKTCVRIASTVMILIVPARTSTISIQDSKMTKGTERAP